MFILEDAFVFFVPVVTDQLCLIVLCGLMMQDRRVPVILQLNVLYDSEQTRCLRVP